MDIGERVRLGDGSEEVSIFTFKCVTVSSKRLLCTSTSSL